MSVRKRSFKKREQLVYRETSGEGYIIGKSDKPTLPRSQNKTDDVCFPLSLSVERSVLQHRWSFVTMARSVQLLSGQKFVPGWIVFTVCTTLMTSDLCV